MQTFRGQYPVETSELDNAIESAHGYRELHKRLTDDDLPRFQRTFKTYLNQNTIRDIATFHSQLTKQADLIKDRIGTINASLVGVDYNRAGTSGSNRSAPATWRSRNSRRTCGPAPTTPCLRTRR